MFNIQQIWYSVHMQMKRFTHSSYFFLLNPRVEVDLSTSLRSHVAHLFMVFKFSF